MNPDHTPPDASHCPCYFNDKGNWSCCQCNERNEGVNRSRK